VRLAQDAKPGGFKDLGEVSERRREEVATLGAERREATLHLKRLRRDASAASLGLSWDASAADLEEQGAAERVPGTVDTTLLIIRGRQGNNWFWR